MPLSFGSTVSKKVTKFFLPCYFQTQNEQVLKLAAACTLGTTQWPSSATILAAFSSINAIAFNGLAITISQSAQSLPGANK